MLQVTPHMRILLAVEPVDFRKGIDGLGGVCRQVLKQDPLSGTVFVFHNKRRTAIKLLVFDGQGFWICMKRLSKGRFRQLVSPDGLNVCSLAAHELQVLLVNGNPSVIDASPVWKSLPEIS